MRDRGIRSRDSVRPPPSRLPHAFSRHGPASLRCHLGRVLRYDTVSQHGWAVDIRTHGIRAIVERLLSQDWEPPSENGPGREVPEWSEEEECVVCFSVIF